jgi:hypothetical protein
MFLRVATLIAAVSVTSVIGAAAPDAHGDPQTKDQQFLSMVRSNGVAKTTPCSNMRTSFAT